MRFDMFTPIHKALRRSLFETAIALGRTDFAVRRTRPPPPSTRSPTAWSFLREHAEHEDRQVLPEIARLAPELAAIIRDEPPRAGAGRDRGRQPVAAAGGAAGRRAEERQALGGELLRRFHVFLADELLHMDREERELNALLWARLTDAEIMAISNRITSSISPERMRTWGELLMPALNGPEREAMLARAAAAAGKAA